MTSGPGLLAVRAINQYRRRDVIAYLGLRYYLGNSAAQSDRWAREVAPDLVIRRSEPVYLRVQHFKEVDSMHRVSHREMLLPGPNEALVEAALLDACAKAGGTFEAADCVFSYRLANSTDSSGVFQHYMHGLRERHRAVASACRRRPDARVLHVDVRRFYPSVSVPRATAAWLQACELQRLAGRWTDVGLRLLSDHGLASDTKEGHILTGPMFSHLLANLLLRNVDQQMASLPARYFRYVDDITLVGSQAELDNAVAILKSLLNDLDLAIHGQESSKWLDVSAREWLQGEHDFAQSKQGVSWMTLVGDLKRFLVIQPGQRESLKEAFESNGIRLPVPDYAAAIQERAYKVRFAELWRTPWFRRILH